MSSTEERVSAISASDQEESRSSRPQSRLQKCCTEHNRDIDSFQVQWEQELQRRRHKMHDLEGKLNRYNLELDQEIIYKRSDFCKFRHSPVWLESQRNRLQSRNLLQHSYKTHKLDKTAITLQPAHRGTYLTCNLSNVFHSFRQTHKYQSHSCHRSQLVKTSINHANILPEFDPSLKGHRINVWLEKVNEYAAAYGWDERTTIHFARQKLQGSAKMWCESLNSILYSWEELQQKLKSAFPAEQNYGQRLEDMLKRKSGINEPIELYYYDKLALLNFCDMGGKRAVDCIIHGISDKKLKSSASAIRCTEPEDLLKFLIKTTKAQYVLKNNFDCELRVNSASRLYTSDEILIDRRACNEIVCYKCKEKGHPYLKCPKRHIYVS